MKEKKNIFQRIKNWWDSLAPEDKGLIKGMVIGGISATTGAMLSTAHQMKKQIAIDSQITEDMCSDAYWQGLKDGEIKGYYNLLVNTDEHAFKKMGMTDVKVKHF